MHLKWRILISFCLLLIGMSDTAQSSESQKGSIKVFLAGDTMTGRGVDQILPHSVDPRLHEPWVKDARQYVRIAEEKKGPIPEKVEYDYIWGDALRAWEKFQPDTKIINLETSITTNDTPWPGKGIHYRMHPKNIPVLKAAGIDCCVLANNHVMDWGQAGLLETLKVLRSANISTVGAGRNKAEAWEPAIFNIRGNRVLLFAFAMPSAGVPADWEAQEEKPGVAYLPDLSSNSLEKVKRIIGKYNEPGDHLIVSVHWGGNWGYEVPENQTIFARSLIDEAGADIIYGHSSHHPKPMEVYKGQLILYGCGDFLNDYEGIGGHQQFRPELSLMYFATLQNDSGKLLDGTLVPRRIERFCLNPASEEESKWLARRLNQESSRFDTDIEILGTDKLKLELK